MKVGLTFTLSSILEVQDHELAATLELTGVTV